MKKVGIITLYGLFNYGNRLQNYAVHKILSDMGLQVITYTCEPKEKIDKKMYLRWKVHELTRYRFTQHKDYWNADFCRLFNFRRFTKKNIPTQYISSIDDLATQADYFVVGSDQVWNPLWYHHFDKDLFLLTFARPEQKVCFSPSFGIEKLPEEWEMWFTQKLVEFPHLNVREQAGAEIIRQLTGKTADVMIDPTLMLDEKDWLRIAKKPKSINTTKPYILTYFLGKRTDQVEKDIIEILQQKKRNVYHLFDKIQDDVYSSGPCEFIYLFSKADIILTDSFHACVFAFLFNKPFVVYDRVEKGICKMNSRLNTLLSLLKLERKYRSKNIANNWFEAEYAEGWEILNKERKKVRECLQMNLK